MVKYSWHADQMFDVNKVFFFFFIFLFVYRHVKTELLITSTVFTYCIYIIKGDVFFLFPAVYFFLFFITKEQTELYGGKFNIVLQDSQANMREI